MACFDPPVVLIIIHSDGAPIDRAREGSMRVWCRVSVGVLASVILGGCEAPTDIVPVTPPGAVIPRQSPDAEPAAAQGEMAAPLLKTESQPVEKVEYTPAPPTAKGETKTTPGGVKYETLKEGSGPELKPGQPAQFRYKGSLEDGKVFTDRSVRPEIMTIDAKMTRGWQEAIPGMKAGEIRKLIVPSGLGYGVQGNPTAGIPPNANMIFEVELVRIIGG
jgi:FKBP-type peptidyl-prolyl cis-trans isomerase